MLVAKILAQARGIVNKATPKKIYRPLTTRPLRPGRKDGKLDPRKAPTIFSKKECGHYG
jgi:hypothetical protein